MAALIALVGTLSPSDSLEWDSLAYHLAVPKLWIAAGRITEIPFIHHSNFPFVVDNLYIWGLTLGESAAKTFNVAFLIFGCMSLFGLARQRYGERAGWWAAAIFATVPTVLWEAGTAYIDMAHGLYAGLGACLVLSGKGDRLDVLDRSDESEKCDPSHMSYLSRSIQKGRPTLILGAILLSLAVGSKYTGLQVVLAACVVLALASIRRHPSCLRAGYPAATNALQGIKVATLAGLIALAIGSPWYIKNVLWTGNPVYPFFYEKLDGRNWSEFNAKIYAEEQATFGVPKTDVTALPQAILGLAYQPGRYTNPTPKLSTESDPPTGALGFPLVAFGAAALLGPLFWAFSGPRGEEARLCVFLLLSFLIWACLSQQSRYAVAFVPPMALLGAGAIARLRARPILAVIASLQMAYTLWLVYANRTADQLPVVLGKVSKDDYLAARAPFFSVAQDINGMGATVQGVALYDEVFGYFLDRPYYWANPGHGMEIDYFQLDSGAALVARLKELGMSHVYLNLSLTDSKTARRMVEAMGLSGPPRPYSAEEKEAAFRDPRTKWRILAAEAVGLGDLVLTRQYERSLLFEIRDR